MAHCTRHHPHAERVHTRRRAERIEDERLAILALIVFVAAFLFAGTMDFEDRVLSLAGQREEVRTEAPAW